MTIDNPALKLRESIAVRFPDKVGNDNNRVESGDRVRHIWNIIGGFGSIANWHPAIENCEVKIGSGPTLRTLSLRGGGVIIEKLDDWDADHASYTYSIVESPLPVANYRSTISVEAEADGATRISWAGTFDAKGSSEDEAVDAVKGVYRAGLLGIVKTLEAEVV